MNDIQIDSIVSNNTHFFQSVLLLFLVCIAKSIQYMTEAVMSQQWRY